MFMHTIMRCATIAFTAAALGITTTAQASVRINEVTIMPDAGSTHWVELYNAGDDPVSLDGYVLTDEDGNDYEFPATLPAVPAGAFVVVYFDGLDAGANDEDFGDDLAELHTPPGVIDPIDSDGDQLSLYNDIAMTSATITDFVAWGRDPGIEAANAVEAGLWPGITIEVQVGGLGVESPKGPIPSASPDATLGVPEDPDSVTFNSWAVYPAAGATPGALNPAAPIVIYQPEDGTEIWSGGDVQFSWVERPDAVHYDFQLCDDPDCLSVVIDAPAQTDPYYVAAGPLPAPVDYYWRVRAEVTGGGTTDWSPPATFFYDDLDFDNPPPSGFDPPRGANNLNDANGPQPPGFVNQGKGNAPRNQRGAPPTFTVSGTIKDAVSGRGLSGVTVTLTPGPHSAMTNAAGNYSIANVPNGNFAVAATLTNYSTANGNITVNGANFPNLNGNLRGNNSFAAVTALAARKDTQLLCLDGCE